MLHKNAMKTLIVPIFIGTVFTMESVMKTLIMPSYENFQWSAYRS